MASTTSNDFAYQILQVPTTSPHLTKLIAKYRDTKLAALQTSPSEWIYQYDSESIHAFTVWENRFTRQNNILVAVVRENTNLSTEDTLLRREWAAFAVLRGPLSYEQYYAAPEMEQTVPENPNAETRWHLYDLYTFPEHRGRGVARDLFAASFAAATEVTARSNTQSEMTNKARIRLFVKWSSTRLVDMYKRLGFQENGKASLKEGLEANGMAESIPSEDTMSSDDFKRRFNTRIGVAMEKVVDIIE